MPGRRRNQRNGNAKLHAKIKLLEHRANGVVIRPKPDPRATVMSPWWRLTIVTGSTEPSGQPYTVADLRVRIGAQLGLSTTSPNYFIFRLEAVRLWGATSGTSIQAIVYDPINSLNIMTELVDAGTGANRAAIGYVYPARVSSTALLPGNTNRLLSQITGATGTSILVHFDLTIKFTPSMPS